MAAGPLRVLFCMEVTQNFFDLPKSAHPEVFAAFGRTREDLKGRFNIQVLGTIDDDQIAVGPALGRTWTSYILADCPDYDTVAAFCNQFRTTVIGDGPDILWKYARVEARIGRPLSFEKLALAAKA